MKLIEGKYTRTYDIMGAQLIVPKDKESRPLMVAAIGDDYAAVNTSRDDAARVLLKMARQAPGLETEAWGEDSWQEGN